MNKEIFDFEKHRKEFLKLKKKVQKLKKNATVAKGSITFEDDSKYDEDTELNNELVKLSTITKIGMIQLKEMSMVLMFDNIGKKLPPDRFTDYLIKVYETFTQHADVEAQLDMMGFLLVRNYFEKIELGNKEKTFATIVKNKSSASEKNKVNEENAKKYILYGESPYFFLFIPKSLELLLNVGKEYGDEIKKLIETHKQICKELKEMINKLQTGARICLAVTAGTTLRKAYQDAKLQSEIKIDQLEKVYTGKLYATWIEKAKMILGNFGAEEEKFPLLTFDEKNIEETLPKHL